MSKQPLNAAGNRPLTGDKPSPLLTFMSEAFPLSPQLKDAFKKVIVTRKLRRKQMLVKEGELCTTLYFIQKGITRAYLLRNNKDITLWISIENEFETAVESFFNGKPAKENIIALEDCIMESVEASDLHELSLRFPEVNVIMRHMMQEYYIGSEERALMGRLPSALERYNYLLEIRPHLFARASLKHIASFLGIRLETLSRLRNKRRKSTN